MTKIGHFVWVCMWVCSKSNSRPEHEWSDIWLRMMTMIPSNLTNTNHSDKQLKFAVYIIMFVHHSVWSLVNFSLHWMTSVMHPRNAKPRPAMPQDQRKLHWKWSIWSSGYWRIQNEWQVIDWLQQWEWVQNQWLQIDFRSENEWQLIDFSMIDFSMIDNWHGPYHTISTNEV